MIKERIIRYRGEKITILFSVDRCTHVAACLEGAPEVFDSKRRPWALPNAASPDKIADVIETCPTGALHYERRDGGPAEAIPSKNTIIIETHGPLYFKGNLELKDHNEKLLLKDTRVAFCRCGLSKIKPFCENTHLRVGFEESGKIQSDPGAVQETLPDGKITAVLIKNGPIKISGPVTIKNEEGNIIFQGTKALLCRCGSSKKMPFCDGSHGRSGFQSEIDCARIV